MTWQVWRHTIGTGQGSDTMVFEDNDELFWVGVGTSRDGSLVLIESESKETMEVPGVDRTSPSLVPSCEPHHPWSPRVNLTIPGPLV
jgi:oligopeptidase B